MRFVTMADNEFMKGALTLIYSLKRNGNLQNPIKCTIIELGKTEEIYWEKLQELNIEYDRIKINDLKNDIQFDEDLLRRPGLNIRQNKFQIFRLPYDEKICYLDADQLCLGDVSKIEEYPTLTAGLNLGSDYPQNVNGYPMFNTGLLIFESSRELFQEIKQFVNDYNRATEYGDQAILNEFLYKSNKINVNILGVNWNVIITVKKYLPHLWKFIDEEGIKFLHYTNKPWDENKSTIDSVKTKIRNRIYYKKEMNIWNRHYNEVMHGRF